MEDILRIQVQCKNHKINYIKSKNKFPNNSIINYINFDMARDTILDYYESTIRAEDFYSINEARKIINSERIFLRDPEMHW